MESLVKIQREEREIAETQDLSTLSDTELLHLAKRGLEVNNNKDTISENERSDDERK